MFPQYDAATIMLHRRDVLPTWRLAFRPILVSSHQRILFLIVWESFRCILANSKQAVMCFLLRSGFLSGHSTIKGLIGGVLQRWENLPEGQPSPQRSYVRVTIGFPIAQFGWVASSRKSLGGSKLFPFKNDGGHSVLGDLQCCRTFLVPFPDLYLGTILSWSSTDNSFNLMTWFLLWHALSIVGPSVDRCVPFQIMSNQWNLPPVDSNQDVETSRMINGNRMRLSSTKGSEYLYK
jgi:hypothetical protein